MADEPVVVSKAQPVKASNGVEGKTELTIGNVFGGIDMCQKPCRLRRGEVIFESSQSRCHQVKAHKLLNTVGHPTLVKSDIGTGVWSWARGVAVSLY